MIRYMYGSIGLIALSSLLDMNAVPYTLGNLTLVLVSIFCFVKVSEVNNG